MKKCTKCKNVKRLTEFYPNYGMRNKGNHEALDIYCKPCRYLLTSIYKEKNKEKIQEYWKEYYKQHKKEKKVRRRKDG